MLKKGQKHEILRIFVPTATNNSRPKRGSTTHFPAIPWPRPTHAPLIYNPARPPPGADGGRIFWNQHALGENPTLLHVTSMAGRPALSWLRRWTGDLAAFAAPHPRPHVSRGQSVAKRSPLACGGHIDWRSFRASPPCAGAEPHPGLHRFTPTQHRRRLHRTHRLVRLSGTLRSTYFRWDARDPTRQRYSLLGGSSRKWHPVECAGNCRSLSLLGDRQQSDP